jgi:Protein of unknown function (DUF3626)
MDGRRRTTTAFDPKWTPEPPETLGFEPSGGGWSLSVRAPSLLKMTGPVEQAILHVRHHSNGEPVPPGLPITINFHPDTILSGVTTIQLLAREGIYRSQFETHTSNGGLTAYPGGDRWVWESRIFGGAHDGADPSLRPKYGALNYRADPFGGLRLRLQPVPSNAALVASLPSYALPGGQRGQGNEISFVCPLSSPPAVWLGISLVDRQVGGT